jgi:hypothetical protein
VKTSCGCKPKKSVSIEKMHYAMFSAYGDYKCLMRYVSASLQRSVSLFLVINHNSGHLAQMCE